MMRGTLEASRAVHVHMAGSEQGKADSFILVDVLGRGVGHGANSHISMSLE
jgi:hypothetical protein